MVLLKIFLIHAWKGQSEYVKKKNVNSFQDYLNYIVYKVYFIFS